MYNPRMGTAEDAGISTTSSSPIRWHMEIYLGVGYP